MLRVQGLVCGYGKEIVLKDVDFSVEGGGFLGILGPNGSGKTTLLNALTRILEPQHGKILLRGRPVQEMPLRDFAAEFAVVSQMVPKVSMTVEDFVLLGRTPHHRPFQFLETRKDFEIAEQAMRLTGIPTLRERPMDRISGGERQLAAIARALAQEPRWLVLDEPTAHLDIAHQMRILDLLTELNREKGLAIIMVLHDLNLAGEYCKQLLLLHHGKVFKEGRPEEVLEQKNLEEVYGTSVITGKNPASSRPFVLPVSSKQRNKKDLL